METQTRNLARIPHFVRDNSKTFTESGVRNMINRADKNGMDKHEVIVRIGRSVFIDVDNFWKWVKAQQGGA